MSGKVGGAEWEFVVGTYEDVKGPPSAPAMTNINLFAEKLADPCYDTHKTVPGRMSVGNDIQHSLSQADKGKEYIDGGAPVGFDVGTKYIVVDYYKGHITEVSKKIHQRESFCQNEG